MTLCWRDILGRVLIAGLVYGFLVGVAYAGPPADLIQRLADRAAPILNDDSLAAPERANRMRDVLRAAMDRQKMAPALLGRYWRRANAGQQAELTDLLEAYLVNSYASRVDSIDGDVSFSVGGERDLGDRVMVDSQVIRPSGPPVSVTWQVEDGSNGPAVTDIVVEGVSLIVSQRADFASVIRQQGGIDGLIRLLQQKVGQ